jgi:hypothetical protein
MKIYRTLCFVTEAQAKQAENDISNYFGNRLINSQILIGIDERNKSGYYVEYILND